MIVLVHPVGLAPVLRQAVSIEKGIERARLEFSGIVSARCLTIIELAGMV